MEILNLAAAALFESLNQNNIDKIFLIEDTDLNLNDILNPRKKHTWQQFIKMYENCARLLGPEKAAREIAHYGLFNDNLTTLRKVGTSLLDSKLLYWYLASFGSKHLFKDNVRFNFSKINSSQITMEVIIDDELTDCPLLLETYTYLYENVPTLLGLPKAFVTSDISERRGLYTITIAKSSYFKHSLSKFFNILRGNKNTVALLGEIENQSIELAKTVEEKSQLLRMVSHDINNQVTVIDSHLNRTLRKGNLNEEDKRSIEIAKNSSQRLVEILKNVESLEISQIKGLTLGPVDMSEVFESLQEQYRLKLEKKNITLVLKNNLPVSIFPYAERRSLESNILGNLLSNAIKFSNSNSQIELEASLYEGVVSIKVTDQGIGIPASERQNIFHKKMRSSQVGTLGEKGTGFGIGIVKNYVILFNGKISVHQNFPTGTIFAIELPVYKPLAFDSIYQYTHGPSDTIN